MTRRETAPIRPAIATWVHVVILSAAIGTGCGAKRLDYTPTASMTPAEAREVVQQAVESQPDEYAPDEVVVSSEKLEIRITQVKRSLLAGGVVAAPRRTVVYFNDFGRTDVSETRGLFVVRLWDSAGLLRVHVVCTTETRAKALADAFATLRQAHSR